MCVWVYGNTGYVCHCNKSYECFQRSQAQLKGFFRWLLWFPPKICPPFTEIKQVKPATDMTAPSTMCLGSSGQMRDRANDWNIPNSIILRPFVQRCSKSWQKSQLINSSICGKVAFRTTGRRWKENGPLPEQLKEGWGWARWEKTGENPSVWSTFSFNIFNGGCLAKRCIWSSRPVGLILRIYR